MVKRHEEQTYVFAVNMRNTPAQAVFHLRGLKAGGTVEVLNESRSVDIRNGEFGDGFKGYEVHLYRLKAR
jgi:hypothetical protein